MEGVFVAPAAPPAVPPAVPQQSQSLLIKHFLRAGAPQKESEAFEFIVRAQLNTTAAKADVYFATDPNTHQCHIIKGPLKASPSMLFKFKEWKEAHGLPTINVREIQLIPDRWPEGVALGIRNKLLRTTPQTFLVFDSLVQANKLVTKMHISKVWPVTEVVDWDAVNLHLNVNKLNQQEMTDYVKALLARWVHGINDLADRNFLCADGRVYSIDEEEGGIVVNFWNELKKNKCAVIQQWLDSYYETLELNKWNIPDKCRTILNSKVATLALFAPPADH